MSVCVPLEVRGQLERIRSLLPPGWAPREVFELYDKHLYPLSINPLILWIGKGLHVKQLLRAIESQRSQNCPSPNLPAGKATPCPIPVSNGTNSRAHRAFIFPVVIGQSEEGKAVFEHQWVGVEKLGPPKEPPP